MLSLSLSLTVPLFFCLLRGVDDILPIMSYVIIRSALPQLVSETAVMEEFIQEGWGLSSCSLYLSSLHVFTFLYFHVSIPCLHISILPCFHVFKFLYFHVSIPCLHISTCLYYVPAFACLLSSCPMYSCLHTPYLHVTSSCFHTPFSHVQIHEGGGGVLPDVVHDSSQVCLPHVKLM